MMDTSLQLYNSLQLLQSSHAPFRFRGVCAERRERGPLKLLYLPTALRAAPDTLHGMRSHIGADGRGVCCQAVPGCATGATFTPS